LVEILHKLEQLFTLSVAKYNKKTLLLKKSFFKLRSRPDSNWCGSFCRALPSLSATGPFYWVAKIRENNILQNCFLCVYKKNIDFILFSIAVTCVFWLKEMSIFL
jgi:hypothetical protein